MPADFPIFIDIRQKHILIFGAGTIAARRIAILLAHGAKVKAAAPQINEAVWQLKEAYPGQLGISQRAYRMGEIPAGTAFVLAATDSPEVNACICQECRQKQIPVNNASDSSQCDFYFPAIAEHGSLAAGIVSTDGNHKKVAAFRKKLQQLMQECSLTEAE